MQLLFASAFMALFATAPGAAGSSSIRGVVDNYNSQDFESSSSSFDIYLQANSSTDNADAEMMDLEEEIVNSNNVFVTLGNRDDNERSVLDNSYCVGIGWHLCTRRSPHDCTWTCNYREHAGDHDCCLSADDDRSIKYKNSGNSNNRDDDCKGIGWGDCSRFSPYECKWICDDRQTAGDHACCVAN